MMCAWVYMCVCEYRCWHMTLYVWRAEETWDVSPLLLAWLKQSLFGYLCSCVRQPSWPKSSWEFCLCLSSYFHEHQDHRHMHTCWNAWFYMVLGISTRVLTRIHQALNPLSHFPNLCCLFFFVVVCSFVFETSSHCVIWIVLGFVSILLSTGIIGVHSCSLNNVVVNCGKIL